MESSKFPEPKNKLCYFVRRVLGPDFTIDEAARFIRHTTPGIYLMYKRDPDKLKALFLGYKAMALEDDQNKNDRAA